MEALRIILGTCRNRFYLESWYATDYVHRVSCSDRRSRIDWLVLQAWCGGILVRLRFKVFGVFFSPILVRFFLEILLRYS